MNTAARLIDDPHELAGFTRWQPGGEGSRAESSLRLDGLRCSSCALTIETELRRLPGVLGASVSYATQTARVRWDSTQTRPSRWIEALAQLGYGAVPDTAAAAREQRRRERRLMLWRVFVASFCSMQIMMLAAPAYFSRAGELPADQLQLLAWAQWLLSLPIMAFAAAPFFRGAWTALRRARLGMDVPVALGIAAAFVASSLCALAARGTDSSSLYFDSLGMFVSFLLIGRLLEMSARHRAETQLEGLLHRLPEGVSRLREDGSTELVSVHALRAGDRLRVPVGQAFAADGVLVRGSTTVDEALLTGESRPLPRREGEAVIAGSLNLGAPVEMRVERCGAETRYEAIAALMRDARSQRPDVGRVADAWAGPFLLAVLLLAMLAAIVWHFIEPARSVQVFVAVLIVTCPCALSLAAPSALLSATTRLARSGVLLRRLDALEALAQAQHLFIDKTGTVSESLPQCTGMHLIDETGDAARLEAVAASLAGWSRHPLARSLAHRATSTCGMAWRDLREQAGAGVEARDDAGRLWRLGSANWTGARESTPGASTVWLGCDGRALARFDFGEQLRSDSAAALQALSRQGLAITMLSGDVPGEVQALGRRLGLADCRGGLSPEDKLAALREAQERGEVTIAAGDGINDAPLLARADVAVAMGEGADLAQAQADLVLTGNSLAGLAEAVSLSRRTMRVVRQNIVWAIAYNLACIPLALLGLLPPWAAGLGMACSSLVVVLNALRLAR